MQIWRQKFYYPSSLTWETNFVDEVPVLDTPKACVHRYTTNLMDDSDTLGGATLN